MQAQTTTRPNVIILNNNSGNNTSNQSSNQSTGIPNANNNSNASTDATASSNSTRRFINRPNMGAIQFTPNPAIVETAKAFAITTAEMKASFDDAMKEDSIKTSLSKVTLANVSLISSAGKLTFRLAKALTKRSIDIASTQTENLRKHYAKPFEINDEIKYKLECYFDSKDMKDLKPTNYIAGVIYDTKKTNTQELDLNKGVLTRRAAFNTRQNLQEIGDDSINFKKAGTTTHAFYANKTKNGIVIEFCEI